MPWTSLKGNSRIRVLKIIAWHPHCLPTYKLQHGQTGIFIEDLERYTASWPSTRDPLVRYITTAKSHQWDTESRTALGANFCRHVYVLDRGYAISKQKDKIRSFRIWCRSPCRHITTQRHTTIWSKTIPGSIPLIYINSLIQGCFDLKEMYI